MFINPASGLTIMYIQSARYLKRLEYPHINVLHSLKMIFQLYPLNY